MSASFSLSALDAFPLVKPGDDLAGLISDGLRSHDTAVADGDILVIAQKIISKAEGRLARLDDFESGDEARYYADITGKDPRLVEAVLSQSKRVLRAKQNVLIVEHKLGFVHANAGIDQSNVVQNPDDPMLLLLPKDPDASARLIRDRIHKELGVNMGVVVNDSMGRAWRVGTIGQAIGCAGLRAHVDMRGDTDMFGRVLEVTEVAVADEIASAASLLMGEAAEGRPVVVFRGAGAFVLPAGKAGPGISVLLRRAEDDLFRD